MLAEYGHMRCWCERDSSAIYCLFVEHNRTSKLLVPVLKMRKEMSLQWG